MAQMGSSAHRAVAGCPEAGGGRYALARPALGRGPGSCLRRLLACVAVILTCAGAARAYGRGFESSLEAFFEAFGVEFPEGSFITYVWRVSCIVAHNTLPNLEKIRSAIEETERCPPQVEIGVAALRVKADLAAKWGLDGWPAPDPAATPLGRDTPSRLTEQEAMLFLKSCHAALGVDVLGTGRFMTVSGNTGFVRNVSRKQLAGGLARGDEATNLGFVVMATPTVAADGQHVDLEMQLRVTMLYMPGAEEGVDATGATPVIERSWETKAVLKSGHVFLLVSGFPSLRRMQGTIAEPEFTVFLIQARVLQVGEARGLDRAVW